MEITSMTNAKIKQWAKYKEKKYRDQDRQFLIEGEHLLKEAHQARLINCILIEKGCVCPYSEYPVYEVTRDILKKLAGSVSGTHIMGVCHYPKPTDVMGTHILALDGVQDPGNVGTMLRTAYAFAYDTILLSDACADVYSDKVIRSTQGALFHLHIQRCDLSQILPSLHQQGYTLYGTALRQATPLSNLQAKHPHVLLMGNEGNGVHLQLLSLCDENIYIEMHTFESLNVAVAASICMYELTKTVVKWKDVR